MSFVFKAFTKSRRKKNTGGRLTGISEVTTTTTTIGQDTYASKLPSSSLVVDDPKQGKYSRSHNLLTVSQTDEEDDDRTHPMNEQSPSHCSGASTTTTTTTSIPLTPPVSSIKGGKSSSRGLCATSTAEPSRRGLFKSLRRKSEVDVMGTPDTVATSSSSSSSPGVTTTTKEQQQEQSHPSPPTVRRGKQNKFSEIYMPTEPVRRKLTFQDQQQQDSVPKSKQVSPNSNAEPPNLLNHKKIFSELKRGKRTIEPRRMNNRKKMNDGISTTKTLIMNGDLVVCATHDSPNASDTATTVSAMSAASSKARALRREAERNARTAAALDNKGNELFEMGHYDKAMSCYSKALKLKRRTFNHLLEEADDMEEQLMMCEEETADPQILVSMATSINNIGYLRQRNGEATPDETMAAYEKSLRIKRRILGNDSLSVGKTLNNIGSVHYLKREFDQALPAYEEALKIMKANLGDKHSDVATVMSNIGDVYLGLGNTDLSLLKYRQALTIRWDTFGEKDPRVRRLLEKIAKVEIGDRMLTPKASRDEAQQAWDDDEASEFLETDKKPISTELRMLQQQIARDIEHVDAMERKATVEMLKDKIIIIRGMRAIWEGSGPELLDNDTASVMTGGKSLKSQACNV
jgi:tetratricopeptide (TPR) repeat protein